MEIFVGNVVQIVGMEKKIQLQIGKFIVIEKELMSDQRIDVGIMNDIAL